MLSALSLTCDAFANLISSCMPLRTGAVWVKIAARGIFHIAAVRRSCWHRFNQSDVLPQGSGGCCWVVSASKIHKKRIFSTQPTCKDFERFPSSVVFTLRSHWLSLLMWNMMWGISVFSCGYSQGFLNQLSGGVSSSDPSALFWFYLALWCVCTWMCTCTKAS